MSERKQGTGILEFPDALFRILLRNLASARFRADASPDSFSSQRAVLRVGAEGAVWSHADLRDGGESVPLIPQQVNEKLASHSRAGYALGACESRNCLRILHFGPRMWGRGFPMFSWDRAMIVRLYERRTGTNCF